MIQKNKRVAAILVAIGVLVAPAAAAQGPPDVRLDLGPYSPAPAGVSLLPPPPAPAGVSLLPPPPKVTSPLLIPDYNPLSSMVDTPENASRRFEKWMADRGNRYDRLRVQPDGRFWLAPDTASGSQTYGESLQHFKRNVGSAGSAFRDGAERLMQNDRVWNGMVGCGVAAGLAAATGGLTLGNGTAVCALGAVGGAATK